MTNTFLTPRLEQAMELAIRVHGNMKRKGDDQPYLVHPMSVLALLVKWGADEDACIAGLLHDVIEDADNDVQRAEYRKEITKKFGAEVLEIVEGVTEQDKSLPWRTRKDLYLEHLKVASVTSLLVSCADHTHNSQSLAEIYAVEGEDVWKRFNAGKEEKLWYLRESIQILEQRLEERYVVDFRTNIERLYELMSYPTSPKVDHPKILYPKVQADQKFMDNLVNRVIKNLGYRVERLDQEDRQMRRKMSDNTQNPPTHEPEA
ncbi:MAG: metal dependent phosphohydrolase [Candidatus Peregrinibacteria bacterium Greene0416_19]|nr:MAG: metal dependent phosphohydrolase [Candidatus Peregrinibacteria bacterium Greene0416_19]